MIRDWWMAHRFELLVTFGFETVLVIGLVIYWFWARRRKS